MLFAQISGKDSLREIENALLANHKRLYHLGMEAVAKSTLSEAMNRRNPEIFKALFEELLDRVMEYAPKHKFKFKDPTRETERLISLLPIISALQRIQSQIFTNKDGKSNSFSNGSSRI